MTNVKLDGRQHLKVKSCLKKKETHQCSLRRLNFQCAAISMQLGP